VIGEPPFPIAIAQLNTDILSTALGASVTAFTSERIGADRGMLGEIFLVRPTYDLPGTGPDAVICKFAALREGALASAIRGGTHERELRCYDELLATSTVRTPHLYGAWYDPETAHFLLVQDAIDSDDTIDQVAGIRPELVALVSREAASLHHQYWGDTRLDSLNWLPQLDDPRRINNLITLAVNGWQPLCDLVGNGLTAQEQAYGIEFPGRLETALRSLAELPSTLIHSDLRADNLLFSADHQSVSLIDWQGAGSGPGSFDIAYLIAHSLTVEDRRKHEAALITGYLATLSAAGTAHTRDEFMQGYVPALHYGLVVACALPLIGDPSEPRVRSLAYTMARRSIEALRDHDAW